MGRDESPALPVRGWGRQRKNVDGFGSLPAVHLQSTEVQFRAPVMMRPRVARPVKTIQRQSSICDFAPHGTKPIPLLKTALPNVFFGEYW